MTCSWAAEAADGVHPATQGFVPEITDRDGNPVEPTEGSSFRLGNGLTLVAMSQEKFDLWNSLTADNKHQIVVYPEQWGMQHPIVCRPDILGCDLNAYLMHLEYNMDESIGERFKRLAAGERVDKQPTQTLCAFDNQPIGNESIHIIFHLEPGSHNLDEETEYQFCSVNCAKEWFGVTFLS